MIRSGAILVGCGLLALLAAVLVHDGPGAAWLLATSIALTVAGVALLVVAPWPTERRPLRVQLAAVDHIEPVVRGGLDRWDNLAPICKTCNSTKNKRTVLEMMLCKMAA